MKKIIPLILPIIFLSCKTEPEFDLKKQNQIVELSRNIFSQKKIDSKEILALIEQNSTQIYQDTVKNKSKSVTIYSNPAAKTYFKIYEKSKGIIFAIAFFKNGKEINTTEYYENGQIQCLFALNMQGVRDGKYNCFHENGNIRITGMYSNGEQTGTEIGFDIHGKKIYEFSHE